MNQLWRRIRYLFERDRRARDLDDEIDTHIAYRAERLRQQGLAEDQAHFAARRQFGNRASLELASDAAWGWGLLERLAQDVCLAARSLRRTPGLAIVAVLTLGVGLGMNTAIFTVVNGVMLRNLPYPEPARVISLWEEVERRSEVKTLNSRGQDLGGNGRQRLTVAAANLADYRASGAFESLAGLEQQLMNLTGQGAPERILGESVTANYFDLLRVRPTLGRLFTEAEDRPGADGVVLLSWDFWQRRLGGDTTVLSRTLLFDGRQRSVIGVLPREFQAASQFGTRERVEFWVPASYSAELLASRGDHEISVVGRLQPGVTVEAARIRLRAVSMRLAEQYPDSNSSIRAAIAPLRDDIVHDVRDSLSALWGASAVIVLITCVNVANLLLVRADGRRHETSVRLALGAGRGRIARQFVLESLVVAGTGCVAGLGLAWMLMRVLIAAAPPNLPRLDGIAMDWQVFAAAAIVATLTGLAFGLAPALAASRTEPGESLKSSERKSTGQGQARWRAALTVAEIALSIVLIVGAGLFLKSFATIMGMELGFRTDNVLAMSINLPEPRYASAQDRFRFFDDLERRARTLPGVQSVAFANRFPMRGGWSTGITVEGAQETNANMDADSQAVSVGYFETLGLGLVRGRRLTDADRLGQLPVAVANLEFERRYLNGSTAIGRRFRRGPKQPWVEIVGVVNDVRRAGKTRDIKPQLYLPAAQTEIYPVRLADFAVRTAGDPHLLVKALQQQVWAIDKDQPVTGVRTLQEVVDRSVSEQRFQMLLLLVFAGVAAALAVIGISGVLTYSINQRRNEIGVRIALGAAPSRIVGMILKQAVMMIAVGVALGVGGALAATRLVANLLFRVQTNDVVIYVAATGLLVLVALAAALLPAVRGARLDPLEALRYE